MADWNKPSSTDAYNNVGGVLDSLAQKDLDAARAFDDASTAPANTPTNAVRISSTEKKIKWWSGNAWIEKVTEWAFNVSGWAGRLKTPRSFSVTGGATAAPVNFDGTGNVALQVTAIDGTKIQGAGSALNANVGFAPGQLPTAERVVFGENGSGSTNVAPNDGGPGSDTITKSGAYRGNGSGGFALLQHVQHPSEENYAFQFGTAGYDDTFIARYRAGGEWSAPIRFWTSKDIDVPATVQTIGNLRSAAFRDVEQGEGLDTNKVMAVGAGGWLSKNPSVVYNKNTNDTYTALRAGGSKIYRNEHPDSYIQLQYSPALYMSTMDTSATLSIGYNPTLGVLVWGTNGINGWNSRLWGTHNFDPNTKLNTWDRGGLGMTGETWHGVPRALNTTYTNTTGKPIMVVFITNDSGGGYRSHVNVGGVTIITFNPHTDGDVWTFIVPTGSYYVLTSDSNANSINSVIELY